MTKEQLKEAIISHEGDMNTLKTKLLKIVDTVFERIDTINSNAFVTGGTLTAAQIAALTNPTKNALYRVITTGGNLNSGGDQITVAVRDIVYHNGTKWVLLVDADAE
jgi:hypothetical protein